MNKYSKSFCFNVIILKKSHFNVDTNILMLNIMLFYLFVLMLWNQAMIGSSTDIRDSSGIRDSEE